MVHEWNPCTETECRCQGSDCPAESPAPGPSSPSRDPEDCDSHRSSCPRGGVPAGLGPRGPNGPSGFPGPSPNPKEPDDVRDETETSSCGSSTNAGAIHGDPVHIPTGAVIIPALRPDAIGMSSLSSIRVLREYNSRLARLDTMAEHGESSVSSVTTARFGLPQKSFSAGWYHNFEWYLMTGVIPDGGSAPEVILSQPNGSIEVSVQPRFEV